MRYRILLMVFVLFLSGNFHAQITAGEYSQKEALRISKAIETETEIQEYIAENIGTYDFTNVINEVSNDQDENGNPLSGETYQQALSLAKKQKLRNNYFSLFPDKLSFYYAEVLKQQCVNGGFENANTAGFSFFSQNYNNSSWNWLTNYPTTPITPGPINSINSRANLVDISANDPIFSGLPRVNSGSSAIKLNFADTGTRTATRMSRVFTIDENFISFNYALILQDVRDGGHVNNPNRAPYYTVTLRRLNGSIVYNFSITGDNFSQFPLSTGPNFLSTGWRCHFINTAAWLGETLQMDIVLSNCGNSGHFVYGYFDNFCGFDNLCSPPTPFINLNPISNENCPGFPLDVTGNFSVPGGATINSFQLEILENNNLTNVVNTINNPVITGSSFVFSLSDFSFYPSGTNSILDFKFRVTISFTSGGNVSTLSYLDGSGNPDVSFLNCSTPCFEVLYLDDPVTNSQLFQVSDAIIASSVLYPDLTVEFRAQNFINLEPGFWVTGESVGDFLAHVAPCDYSTNNTSAGLNKSKKSENLKTAMVASSISIAPNPVSEILHIKSKEKILSVSIYDMSGRRFKTALSTNKVDVRALPVGTYLINVETKDGISTEKFIKK